MTKKRNKKRKLTPFGRAVMKKLIDRNMRQWELTNEVGTDVKYLNMILYGERSGEKYVHKIAECLGININKYIS